MTKQESTTIAIIGAGAAGVGMSVTLQDYGLSDHLVLEAGEVGESFGKWNPATHFISPSFTTNGFGMPDLNAVTAATSPAYSLKEEHPSGRDYQAYLQSLANHYDLPVRSHCRVRTVAKDGEGYRLVLASGKVIRARFVIVAVGDYAFPATGGIKNAHLGCHYQAVKDYGDFRGVNDQVIIGGNESAFDMAINLAARGTRVHLYTETAGPDQGAADPSKRLSTYTNERYRAVADRIRITSGQVLTEIEETPGGFRLHFRGGRTVLSSTRPLLATGFANVQSPLVAKLFAIADQRAVLTQADESTQSPNVFMVGPEVVHESVVLCYVYKYRQRFAPLATTILERLGREIDPAVSDYYRKNNMYLTDLAGCGVNCEC